MQHANASVVFVPFISVDGSLFHKLILGTFANCTESSIIDLIFGDPYWGFDFVTDQLLFCVGYEGKPLKSSIF